MRILLLSVYIGLLCIQYQSAELHLVLELRGDLNG